MIDIHTHCLPYIDDGAKNLTESKALLRDSFEQGVSVCVATPHCVVHGNDAISAFLNRREQSYNALVSSVLCDGEKYPKIYLGAEVLLDHDISQYPDIKKLCIANTNYMLLEFPHMVQSKETFDWLYSLTILGIKPIIAHIERYPNHNEMIPDFSDIDLLYQINASSLLGFSSKSDLIYFISILL